MGTHTKVKRKTHSETRTQTLTGGDTCLHTVNTDWQVHTFIHMHMGECVRVCVLQLQANTANKSSASVLAESSHHRGSDWSCYYYFCCVCVCIGGVTSVKVCHFKGHVEETESFTVSVFSRWSYNTEITSVILTSRFFFLIFFLYYPDTVTSEQVWPGT